MKAIKTFLFIFLGFTGQSVWAQNPLERFEKHTYKNDKNESLPYRLLAPDVKEGKKYPVVLFLHGAGERGNDNTKQLVHGMKDFASEANRKKYPCYVIAPQCPKNKRWVEVSWSEDKHKMPKNPSDPMRLALELLDKTIATEPIDKNRIYITGLSMGGFGTFDAISRRPGLFAAAIPICGGGDESVAGKISSMPIWIVHGDADRVVKPIRSQRMFDAIKEAGGKPNLTMMKGVGHRQDCHTRSLQIVEPWEANLHSMICLLFPFPFVPHFVV